MTSTNQSRETLRRTVLKSTAAAGALAIGVTGTATAQQVPIDPETEIVLGGRRSAWIGEEPEEIAGERNPTLYLQAGETYTVTWNNLDGDGHNIVFQDEDGDERFVETEVISGTTESQTVDVEVEEGMEIYLCGPHPVSMRGEVEVVDDEPVDDEPVDDDVEDPVEALETVVAMPGDPVPENLATDDDGGLYFSVNHGQVRRLEPEQTLNTDIDLEDVELTGELPGDAYGVEVGPDFAQYVAVHRDDQTGLWRLPPVERPVEPEPDDDEGEVDDADDGIEGVGDVVIGDEDDEDDENGNPADEHEADDEVADDEENDATVPTDEEMEAEPFAIIGVEDEVFPNGIELDAERERLLVTESFGGVVYEVPIDADDPDEAAEEWLQDDLLDTPGFGANGLAFGPDGDLFVAVTEDVEDEDLDNDVENGENDEIDDEEEYGDEEEYDDEEAPEERPKEPEEDDEVDDDVDNNEVDDDVENDVEEEEIDEETDIGRIVRVPVEDDGTAGEPETYVEGVELFGADGIEFRPDTEELYVAAIFIDEVLRVTADGEVETVLDAEDGLFMPSDVTFGVTEDQENAMFISNFAPEDPDEGAIFRYTV